MIANAVLEVLVVGAALGRVITSILWIPRRRK